MQMTFRELALENVGPFIGKHLLDLQPEDNRSIVLIGALNGSGKTTLLQLFQIALYGGDSPHIRSKSEYQALLLGLINRSAPNKAAWVELTVDLREELGLDSVVIRRTWRRTEHNEIHEDLAISVASNFDQYLTENWSSMIMSILPPRLADLFFFDGEKIETLTESQTAADIVKRGLYVLLGLDKVDELRRNLKTLKRRRAAMLVEDDNIGDIAKFEEQAVAIEAAKQPIAQERASLQNKLDRTLIALMSAQDRFRTNGGAAFASLERWKVRELEAIGELTRSTDSLRSIAGSELPLVLVGDLLDEGRVIASEEEYAEHAGLIARALRKRDREFVTLLAELGIQKSLAKRITTELENTRPKASRGPRLCTLGVNSDRLSRYDAAQRSLVKSEAEEGLRAHEGISRRVAQAREALDQVPADIQMAELSSNLVLLQNEHDLLVAQMAAIDQTMNELVGRSVSVASQLDAAVSSALSRKTVNADHRRIINHIERSDETLIRYQQAVVRHYSANIATRIIEIFRGLTRKKDLISDLTIDPKTFILHLRHSTGSSMSAAELSAGERQILAFATLSGLAKTAAKRIPTLIDSPLGRLDSQHRAKIAQNYFPQASHQTIIFSTDEEIDFRMWKLLKPYIAHNYLITFEGGSYGSQITTGYFTE